MSRYTLKVLYNTAELERFTNRSGYKLHDILTHDKYNHAGETGPFGEEVKHPNRYEILNSLSEKIHNGNIEETRNFVRNLR